MGDGTCAAFTSVFELKTNVAASRRLTVESCPSGQHAGRVLKSLISLAKVMLEQGLDAFEFRHMSLDFNENATCMCHRRTSMALGQLCAAVCSFC